MVGAFVLWARSIPTAFVLLVAMMKVHLPYGFSSVKLLSVSASGTRFGPVGYEIDLVLCCTTDTRDTRVSRAGAAFDRRNAAPKIAE